MSLHFPSKRSCFPSDFYISWSWITNFKWSVVSEKGTFRYKCFPRKTLLNLLLESQDTSGRWAWAIPECATVCVCSVEVGVSRLSDGLAGGKACTATTWPDSESMICFIPEETASASSWENWVKTGRASSMNFLQTLYYDWQCLLEIVLFIYIKFCRALKKMSSVTDFDHLLLLVFVSQSLLATNKCIRLEALGLTF